MVRSMAFLHLEMALKSELVLSLIGAQYESTGRKLGITKCNLKQMFSTVPVSKQFYIQLYKQIRYVYFNLPLPVPFLLFLHKKKDM